MVTRSRDFFPVHRRRDGKYMEIFCFSSSRNSAHVMLDKQKIPLLAHICVSLFMWKIVEGGTGPTWWRKMMFSFESRAWNVLKYILNQWELATNSNFYWGTKCSFINYVFCLITPPLPLFMVSDGALSSMELKFLFWDNEAENCIRRRKILGNISNTILLL